MPRVLAPLLVALLCSAIAPRAARAWIVDRTFRLPGVSSTVEVAIDGDTILVGQRIDNVARVFVRDGAVGWVLQQTLAPSVAGTTLFGSAVALDGDIAAIASSTTGRVFVFVRTGTTWTEEGTLAPGFSLSIDGDRLAVGEPFYDRGTADNAGRVRIHTRAAGTWAQTGTAQDATAIRAVRMGEAVVLRGSQLLVSAPYGLLTDSRVILFEQSPPLTGTWSARATFSAGDSIGRERALAWDGDLVIAGDPSAMAFDGQVFAITSAGSALAMTDRVVPGSAPLGGSLFGARVAVDGDIVVIGGSPVEVWTHSAGVLTYDFALGGADVGSVAVRGTTVVFDHTVYELAPGDLDGSACTTADRCESGLCVDGVCCAGECGGGVADCQACSVAAGGTSDGACTPLAEAASTTCRAAAGACDLAETCDPAALECPADALAPDGTSCGNGVACDGDETCAAGACAVGAPLACDDADPCTADACMEPSGCASVPIDGCGDAGIATDPDASTTSPDGGSRADGSVTPPDAAGTAMETAGGCGCRAGGSSPRSSTAWLALALAAAAALRRRARARRAR